MTDIEFADAPPGPLARPSASPQATFDAGGDLAVRVEPDGTHALELPAEGLTIELTTPASVVILELLNRRAAELALEALDARRSVVDRQEPIRAESWIPYPLTHRNGVIERIRISGGGGEALLRRIAAL